VGDGVITVIGHDGSGLAEPAARALRAATLVAGGRRHLAALPVPEAARTIVFGDVTAGLDEVLGHDGAAVIVASGDPGFFGIVRALRARGVTPRVLPAVSAVAAAFARAALPWDDALVVSAHGRSLRPVVHACRAHSKVAVLTGPGGGPAELGAALSGTGRTMLVAEDLGGDETTTWCTPEQAAARRWRDPNLVLVLDRHRLDQDSLDQDNLGRSRVDRPVLDRHGLDERRAGGPVWHSGWSGPPRWALPDEAFTHRASMVTKAEVRAVALARLGPRLGDLVWDVGAGSGAVGVECARLGAAVVAVDRDPAACASVTANAAAFDVAVTVVRGRVPEALADLPDPDAVFVGGGGMAAIDACAARRPARLVATYASIERAGAVHAALVAAGYTVEGTLLQASRLAALPDGTHRLAAVNPVILLAGELR
jgi:precorrin-6Y C5,15-methyltransferase (decarboxylating)